MMVCDVYWWFLMVYDLVGWFMMVYDWFMIGLWLTYDGLWLVHDWFMMVYDGLWWFMMVYDWFMIGLWLVHDWFVIGLWLVYDGLWLVYVENTKNKKDDLRVQVPPFVETLGWQKMIRQTWCNKEVEVDGDLRDLSPWYNITVCRKLLYTQYVAISLMFTWKMNGHNDDDFKDQLVEPPPINHVPQC